MISEENIPEELNVGKGTDVILNVAKKEIFSEIEREYRGALFHLEHKGKFYVKLSKRYSEQIKLRYNKPQTPTTEQP